METWKVRGYVPDSDEEEEESQGNFDGEETLSWKEHQKRWRTSREQVTNADLGEASAQAIIEPKRTQELKAVEVRINQNPISSNGGPGLDEQSIPTSLIHPFDEEIDELQDPSYAHDVTGVKTAATTAGEPLCDALRYQMAPTQENARIRDGKWNENTQQHLTAAIPEPIPASSSSLSDISSQSNQDDVISSMARVTLPHQTLDAEGSVGAAMNGQPDLPRRALISAGRTGRNLRQRKAIQLHPYLIESEKYRKTFHDHGIQALRIAQQQSQFRAEVDSQAQEFLASQVSRSSSLELESVGDSQRGDGMSLEFAPDDFEFPDIDTLLNQQNAQFLPVGHKRQRLDRPMFKRPPGLAKRRDTEHKGDGPPDIDRPRTDRSSVQKPLSPPESVSPSSGSDALASRPLKSVIHTPSALPTPAVSSEPRADTSIEIFDVESSDSDAAPGAEDDEGSNTIETISPTAPDPLRRVKHRIRGVLPASWLKLDLQAQTSQPSKHPSKPLSPSPQKQAPLRGVARPIWRYSNDSPRSPSSRAGVFVVSDDEMSEQSDIGGQDALPDDDHITLDTDDANLVDTTRWGEAEEVREVDAMLPTASRPFQRRKSRKRQTRISEFNLPNPPSDLELKRSYKARSSQPRQLPRLTTSKPPQPKFRVPRLSILDMAQEPEPRTGEHQPLFLNIAARTARRRRDKGRHSPTRKVLRLPTHQDTLDANETLIRWRRGRFTPASDLSRTQFRQPLLPRSGNSVRLPASSNAIEGPNNAPTISRDKEIGKLKARKYQTALDTAILSEQHLETLETPSGQQLDNEEGSKGGKHSRGFLQSTMQGPAYSRPAMLEILQEEGDSHHPRRALARHVLASGPPEAAVRLSRTTFQETSHDMPRPKAVANILGAPAHRKGPTRQQDKSRFEPARRRMPRKRRPQRIDLSMTWQEDLDVVPTRSPRESSLHKRTAVIRDADEVPVSKAQVLAGLGPYGTSYTSCFDVVPLPRGTCFHESTFLGSGRFKKALSLQDHLFDRQRGNAVFTLADRNFRWGAWNEDVSSDMSSLCELSLEVCQDHSMLDSLRMRTELLRNCIDHFAEHLHFFDSVDRSAYITKSLSIVRDIMNSNIAIVASEDGLHGLHNVHTKRTVMQLKMFCAVFSHQLHQLTQYSVVPDSINQDAWSVLSYAFRSLREHVIEHCADIEKMVLGFRNKRVARLVIDDEEVAEACVVAYHILLRHDDLLKEGQKTMSDHFCAMIGKENQSVETMEKAWRKMFYLQPLSEFDENGVLETGRRFRCNLDSWSAVKTLVCPVLKTYLSNKKGQPASFNTYCRAIFNRCLYLINSWGWYKCETIISVFFDFFSSNELHNLSHEESHGSPSFLEHLGDNLSLSVAAEDRCFHIFLKIVGAGLRHMRQVYQEKKVGGLLWRLLPNHGRSYPKEESVRHEDLGALRNHHDLLCTLYWAAPANHRPPMTIVRKLVHVESSHRQAIHISIQAWTTLLTYQLSTTEPTDGLKAFVDWFDELLCHILRQHTFARTEAEGHVRSAQHLRGVHVSDRLLEMTISTNQRQIEALISDLLTNLNRAVTVAQTRSAADAIFANKLTSVFSLLDVRQPYTCGPVIDALKPILSYIQRLSQLNRVDEGSNADEDSQDYGDWSAFAPNDMVIDAEPAKHPPLQDIHEPLHTLLSNCFGADLAPTEDLLRTLVDTWAAVSQTLVKTGLKAWSDYVGSYHKDSWASLRNTDQKRKYTAYYLARLLEMDPTIYTKERSFFLRFFMESLVERESLLKFQHVLTGALLNLCVDDPVLANLPFYIRAADRRFDVTARDFSERRLSVISSLLANMRTSLDQSQWHKPADAVDRKHEYRELLIHMMHKMKDNYRELGQASNASGAYVEFLHHVVGFLQQYTINICPVDRFFTEDASFPLPANDPNYVVSRLKNYELRLQDPRAQKELVTFIQSIAERAAVDNQQAYFAEQVYSAISPAFEKGGNHITLRSFVVSAVFPAYTGTAFRTTCGWLLCHPFLQAFKRDFDDMLVHLDGCSAASIETVTETITAYLSATQSSLLDICWQPSLLNQVSCLKTIRAFYDAAVALFPLLNYLTRLGGKVKDSIRCIDDLTTFASSVVPMLWSAEGTDLLYLQRLDAVPHISPFAAIREYATIELKQTLERNWTCVHGMYFVSRGSGRKEVSVDVGLIEEERRDLQNSLARYLKEVPLVHRFVDGESKQPKKEDLKGAWNVMGPGEELLLF